MNDDISNYSGLPESVRQVPGPSVRWQVQTYGLSYDGYVFEDDQSDLCKFLRWLAEQPNHMTSSLRLTVTKVLR